MLLYCSCRFSQNSFNTVSPSSTRSRPSATPRLLVRFRTGYIRCHVYLGGANECVFAAKPREEITISMPNGKEEKGTAWETTPGAIARGISKSLFERTVISMVDGELWDLTRPLEKSCKLELIDFEHEEGTLRRENLSMVLGGFM